MTKQLRAGRLQLHAGIRGGGPIGERAGPKPVDDALGAEVGPLDIRRQLAAGLVAGAERRPRPVRQFLALEGAKLQHGGAETARPPPAGAAAAEAAPPVGRPGGLSGLQRRGGRGAGAGAGGGGAAAEPGAGAGAAAGRAGQAPGPVAGLTEADRGRLAGVGGALAGRRRRRQRRALGLLLGRNRLIVHIQPGKWVQGRRRAARPGPGLRAQ